MFSHLNLLSYLSVVPSNMSMKNKFNIQCDAAQYGDNLNITDCKDLCQAVYSFWLGAGRVGRSSDPLHESALCPALQIPGWQVTRLSVSISISIFIFHFFIFQERLALLRFFHSTYLQMADSECLFPDRARTWLTGSPMPATLYEVQVARRQCDTD